MNSFSNNALSSIQSNKGALFGLDARIAITIFTLLTSISGYLVFSKVEKVRNIAVLRDLEGLESAFQTMQSDLKTFLPDTLIKSDEVSDFEALWDVTKLKPAYQRYWNGPYYSKQTRKHERYGEYRVIYQDETNNPCVYQSRECIGYIALTDVPKETWVAINEYKDESLGQALEPVDNEHLQGIVRAKHATDPRILYYKAFTQKRKGNF